MYKNSFNEKREQLTDCAVRGKIYNQLAGAKNVLQHARGFSESEVFFL